MTDLIQELKDRAQSGELFLDSESKLVYIPIDELYPHPDNPRKDLGDLSELSESIKTKGVMQNLTVVRGHWLTLEEWVQVARADGVTKAVAETMYRDDRDVAWVQDGYTIIIGHRRQGGARLAGLAALPCVIAEMTLQEQVATMLLENMQRSDLTAYEQAKGMQMMFDFGETVDSISEKTGFSKTTVRRRLEMAKLDDKTMREISYRQLSLSDFAALEKIDDIEKRNEILKHIGTSDFDWKLRVAFDNQEFNKKKKPALAQMKKLKAKEISWAQTYGGDYDKIKSIKFVEWDGSSPLIEGEARPLFYRIDDNGGKLINLYVQAPKKKAEKVKKSPKELAKAEAIKRTWAEVDEFDKISFERRRDFVKGLSYKGHAAEMMRGAILAGVAAVFTCNDFEKVKEAVGFRPEDYVGYIENCVKVMELASKADTAFFPKIIYSVFNDSIDRSFFTGSRMYFPVRYDSAALRGLYAWLELCGYEVSSDERAVIEGVSGLYTVGERYK